MASVTMDTSSTSLITYSRKHPTANKRSKLDLFPNSLLKICNKARKRTITEKTSSCEKLSFVPINVFSGHHFNFDEDIVHSKNIRVRRITSKAHTTPLENSNFASPYEINVSSDTKITPKMEKRKIDESLMKFTPIDKIITESVKSNVKKRPKKLLKSG